MITDIEQRMVRARNEIKAQKVATELAYSSLLWPENTATANWSDSLNLVETQGVVARLRVRFTRTDGIDDTPMVNFAQNVNFSPTYAEYMASQGQTITGNDVNFVDDQNYTGYIAMAGSNYMDYYIDFASELIMNYSTLSSVRASVYVEAIAMVKGSLTITRLI